MENNELVMIVLVLIIGCMGSDMIKNMCGDRLVEGFSFANLFLPDPRTIKGPDGKNIPSNATGCYADGCANPLTKSIDEHVNKTISRFNSCNTDNISAVTKTINEFKTNCLPMSEEAQERKDELQLKLDDKAMETGHKGMMCAAPVYCSNNVDAEYKQDATSTQNVTIHNVATYSPVNNLSDNTNIADIVSQQTKFKDSSITGNSDGPHNSQTLADIELKGKDISDQAATFINLVNLNASQNTENKIVQTGTPVYTYQFWKEDEDVDTSTACGKINLDQHSVANQTVSVASSITNSAQLDDKHKRGITVDADNKQVTEHDNTNLNKMADTAAGAWDHTVDGIGGVLTTGMDDMEHGAMGAMILPCIGFGIVLAMLGVCLYLMLGRSKDGDRHISKIVDTATTHIPSGIRDASSWAGDKASKVGTFAANTAQNLPIVGRLFKQPPPQSFEMSGGGLKTLYNSLDSIKLSNEQLIMIITIILLFYNIYR